jgi:bifunctional non-homologous end joining protein LigD
VTGGLQHLPDLVVIQVLECNGDVGRDVDVPSNLGVDSLVVGFYRGKDLIYAARVRAGLVPATRREVLDRIKHLKTPKRPFANLPEPSAGRWGQGLTAEKMEDCVWVRPEVVAEIQFLEWREA